jgi:hypothetical protein
LLRVTWPHSAVVRADGAASISISGALSRLAVNVEPSHVTASTALATHVLAAQRRAQFTCFRAHDGQLSARQRWQFAQRCVLHLVRERRGTLGYSADELRAFKAKREEYSLLWKEVLATSKPSKKLLLKVCRFVCVCVCMWIENSLDNNNYNNYNNKRKVVACEARLLPYQVRSFRARVVASNALNAQLKRTRSSSSTSILTQSSSTARTQSKPSESSSTTIMTSSSSTSSSQQPKKSTSKKVSAFFGKLLRKKDKDKDDNSSTTTTTTTVNDNNDTTTTDEIDESELPNEDDEQALEKFLENVVHDDDDQSTSMAASSMSNAMMTRSGLYLTLDIDNVFISLLSSTSSPPSSSLPSPLIVAGIQSFSFGASILSKYNNPFW